MSEQEAIASTERRAAISPLQAISSGIVAAGAALGLSEILSGLSREIPSLVVSVAEEIVDITPGFIARWSIDTLGSAQKPALVWGIVVVSILLGAVLGWPSRKRPWVMPAGLTVFAVVGGWAAARNPLSSDGLGWMSGLLSGAFGIAVFLSLYVLAITDNSVGAVDEPGEPDEDRSAPMVGRGRFNDRRRFVGAVGVMAGASLAGGLLGRWLRRRDTVEGTRQGVAESLQGRTIATPTARPTPRPTQQAGAEPVELDATPGATPEATAEAGAEPTAEATAEPTPSVTAEPVGESNFDYIAGIAPLITPNEDFYLIDTALSYPQVDPADWSLRIHGMVDREVEIGFEELLDLGLIREQVTLSCVSNSVGGRLVGNAEWVGVPLATVLDQAGVQPRATQIVGRSVDRWTAGFPTEVALDGRVAMVAVQMNGEPLPISHGFPARLVVAGLYGYVSATKWLSDIELTTW
ncbi:MAG: molybdopterin-dependent oxidoreductase, partial [bacterium]|nr:molybdopterin-dependent oxidoreductase [bacterium]